MTATKNVDLAAAITKEAGLPANCYTVSCDDGVVEGIELSLETGPEVGRPWAPHINVKGYRLSRDRNQGCLYQSAEDGSKTAHLRRALPYEIAPEGKKPFHVLRNPGAGPIDFSVLKVDLSYGPFMMNGRALHLNTGILGGKVIYGRDTIGVVMLEDGDQLSCFLPNGEVYTFHQDGDDCHQVKRGGLALIEEHICFGQYLLNTERGFELTGEKWTEAFTRILSGMVDVFHLTTSETSFARAQLMRIELIDSFFKMLPKRELALVEKKLFATLSSLDSALVSMLFPGKGMATVTNIDVARPKGAPPSARARKQRISAQSAAVRNGMKGAASGGGNGKQKRK